MRLSCGCHPLDEDSGGCNVAQASDSMDQSFVGLNGSDIQNIKRFNQFLVNVMELNAGGSMVK
jgi:hypothetical protein